tara:strand:+ start:404 stop:649 length:246 start_codon:yes stop_codon:yes gene_type:complete
LSIEENLTSTTPVRPPRQATQENIKRLAADRIKVSIAKFNEKYSPDTRSGDYEKLDKKVLREIDLANKIKGLQSEYSARMA